MIAIFLASLMTTIVGIVLLVIYLLSNRPPYLKWVFLGALCLFFIYCIQLANSRVPSKERLETALGFPIGKDILVIEDVYHDMLQDYCIDYVIQLTSSDMDVLIKNIDKTTYESEAGEPEHSKWIKDNNHLYYSKSKGGLSQSIKIDIQSRTIKYNECLL